MNEANRKAQTRERVLEIAARQFREHLRTFHAYGDFTSANLRIYGQVPDAVRQANLPIRKEHDEFWQRLLRQAVSRGGLRQGLDPDTTPADWRHYATLEWFDPHRGNIDDLASQYADTVLHGILAEAPAA